MKKGQMGGKQRGYYNIFTNLIYLKN